MEVRSVTLFINDLRSEVSSEAARNANDTKLFRQIKFKVDCEEFKKALSKLGHWTRKG